jgi:hypothetical protein
MGLPLSASSTITETLAWARAGEAKIASSRVLSQAGRSAGLAGGGANGGGAGAADGVTAAPSLAGRLGCATTRGLKHRARMSVNVRRKIESWLWVYREGDGDCNHGTTSVQLNGSFMMVEI